MSEISKVDDNVSKSENPGTEFVVFLQNLDILKNSPSNIATSSDEKNSSSKSSEDSKKTLSDFFLTKIPEYGMNRFEYLQYILQMFASSYFPARIDSPHSNAVIEIMNALNPNPQKIDVAAYSRMETQNLCTVADLMQKANQNLLAPDVTPQIENEKKRKKMENEEEKAENNKESPKKRRKIENSSKNKQKTIQISLGKLSAPSKKPQTNQTESNSDAVAGFIPFQELDIFNENKSQQQQQQPQTSNDNVANEPEKLNFMEKSMEFDSDSDLDDSSSDSDDESLDEDLQEVQKEQKPKKRSIPSTISKKPSEATKTGIEGSEMKNPTNSQPETGKKTKKPRTRATTKIEEPKESPSPKQSPSPKKPKKRFSLSPKKKEGKLPSEIPIPKRKVKKPNQEIENEENVEKKVGESNEAQQNEAEEQKKVKETPKKKEKKPKSSKKAKKPKKNRDENSNSESEEPGEDEEKWMYEEILDTNLDFVEENPNCMEIHYLVKWKGSDNVTWEPESNFDDPTPISTFFEKNPQRRVELVSTLNSLSADDNKIQLIAKFPDLFKL